MNGLKGETTIVEPTRPQQALARRVAEAKATIPELTLDAELELSALRPEDGAALTDYVIRAVALGLREFPLLNASYRDGHFELHSRVNIGVTIWTDTSQSAPTILDADQKPVTQIAAERRELVQRATDGTISSAELAGATFTIADVAVAGITRFQAVISPPQAAVLALAAPRRGGTTALRTASLSCDHRIVYASLAGAFLARLGELLAAPAAWAG